MADASEGRTALVHRPLRILHAVGPGDVVASFRHWKSGVVLEDETSITYSSKYFSFCQANGVLTRVVSSNPRGERIRDGNFIVENRPKPGSGRERGIAYHLRELAYGVAIVGLGVRYRADVALVDSGTSHWFVFTLFRLFGVKVVCNFHNAVWPAGFPPEKRLTRLINRVNGLFLRCLSNACIGVSPECQRQAEQIAGGPLRFIQYRAVYLEPPFAEHTPADFARRPFRVVFAGRLERNKGVFDIIAMAEKLDALRPGQVVFELCGDGSAFAQLAEDKARRGLDQVVILHGKLKRPQLVEIYRRSHLVIVPTTSEFNEAFAMVVAEGILMRRPVLSNPVVPACEVLAPAVVLARTDDVDDYAAKILALMDDPEHYHRLCVACEDLRTPFFDPANGLGMAVATVLNDLFPGRLPVPPPQPSGPLARIAALRGAGA